MISFLRISDFALIESLEMDLGPGLTVLSGETGAGKSIILAAMELLLGQRARAELIREGARAAVVEAQFDLDPAGGLAARLTHDGLVDDPQNGGGLILRRVVSRQGRNRVQVGGSLSTLAHLSEMGPDLVSVCGQHSHQSLLKPEEHLTILDIFAGLSGQAAQVSALVAEVRALDRSVSRAEASLARRRERRDYLEHVVAELSEAGLEEAEEESLKDERLRLANAEKIASAAQNALQGLHNAEDNSVLDILARVRNLLNDLGGWDKVLKPLAGQVEEAFFSLEDAARELQGYVGELSFDQGRLDLIEARLDQIQRLTRKHGGTVALALEVLAQAQRELKALDGGEEEQNTLKEERARVLKESVGLARELTQARRGAARKLAQAVEAELKDLGLARCRFEVMFSLPRGGTLATPWGPLGGRGLEAAEFLIAPNPGEGLRKLTRIASGGELSRIILALKGLLGSRQGSASQIFDEVDAGIGGNTGFQVGAKLARLARTCQVICITHLPQIAAFGDAHYTVSKKTRQGRTSTVLSKLDDEGRLEELARMLAGPGAEASAREHAREMLAAAQHAKGPS